MSNKYSLLHRHSPCCPRQVLVRHSHCRVWQAFHSRALVANTRLKVPQPFAFSLSHPYSSHHSVSGSETQTTVCDFMHRTLWLATIPGLTLLTSSLPFACHGYARGLQAPLPIRPVTGAVAVWLIPGGQIAQVSVTASAPFSFTQGHS